MAKEEIRINESVMRQVIRESVANILREWTEDDIADTKMIKDAFYDWIGDRMPCMETPSGSVIYFDYDENRNVFKAGTVTNAGMAEMECVPAQLDVRNGIEELIDALQENHPELWEEEMNEGLEFYGDEDKEWDPFGEFNDLLENCGWAYCAWEGVVGSNGHKGIRFRLVPSSNAANSVSADEVKNAILDAVNDKSAVHFSTGFNRNAPEQRSLSVVFEDIEDVEEMNEGVIKEEWYPEDEEDIADYTYGAIMLVNLGLIDKEDVSDEKLQELSQIKDEYIEDGYKYPSVMVQNVKFEDDGMESYDVYVKVAVSAPDMPIGEIEEEVLDMVWLWGERKTGKRFPMAQIEDEKVVFDRRTKNI